MPSQVFRGRRRFTIGFAAAAVLASCSSSTPDDSATAPKEPPVDVEDAGAGLDGDAEASIGEGPKLDFSPLQIVISEGDGSLGQLEPSVAADGKGNVVAAWIALFPGHNEIGYANSSDNGTTWSKPQLLNIPNKRGGGDPVVAYDGERFLMLSPAAYAAQDGTIYDGHLFVYEFDLNSRLFGNARSVSDDGSATTTWGADKPWLALDGRGHRLVTYLNPSASDGKFVAAYSSDGVAFSRKPVAPNGYPFPCMDRFADDPPRYIVSLAPSSKSPGLNAVVLHRYNPATDVWEMLPTSGDDAAYQQIECVSSGDDLWIIFATRNAPPSAGTASDPGDAVFVIRSRDRGNTFDGPGALVSEHSAGSLVYLPAMVISQRGNIHVTYYAGKPNESARVFHAFSEDRGAAWSLRALYTAGTMLGQREFADYTGLWSAGGGLYATYTDRSASTARIVFTRVEAP